MKNIFNPMIAAMGDMKYPPCNIKKTAENTYVVELAIAGFSKTDIEVELDGNTLKINGTTKSDNECDFFLKGIASRAFKREFSISSSLLFKNANIMNGILKIAFEQMTPKNKKIKIEPDETDVDSREFLTE